MTVNSRRTEQGQDLQICRSQAVLQGLNTTALGPPRWRIAPEPFWIDAQDLNFFHELGNHLLAFYQAINDLYHQSVRGHQPRWIAQYLDQGKPSDLVAYSRMNRFKSHLPGIIRPDIILTESALGGSSRGRMICTELDSVPGGFGMTGCLAQLYHEQGYQVIGGGDGVVRSFMRMIQDVAPQANSNLAVVVSEESRDYRPEMLWLGEALGKRGLVTYVVEPEQVGFTEKGLFVQTTQKGEQVPVHILYRFFELFDLKNIPKSELILYAAKKDLVTLSPPVKAYLEEKMVFAFFHHPVLRSFWLEKLGRSTFDILESLFPKTWILDPRGMPPYSVIPDLKIGERWITDWRTLGHLSQKERRFVIKPSGFSELAWGSRGVAVGHDLSEQNWQRVIEDALGAFDQTPYILQEFHKGRQVETAYYDFADRTVRRMVGRARLCPYYFVTDGKAKLAGILATVCPLDKKLIHGMVDAVMVPCGLHASA
jgi:hypothetical protein